MALQSIPCHTPTSPSRVRALPALLRASLNFSLPSLTFAALVAASAMPIKVIAQSAPSGERAAARQYSIPGGALEPAITAFARVAAINFSYDVALLQGKRSDGLRGNYAVEAGLAALLTGTGLEAVRLSNGAYSLRNVVPVSLGASANATTLPTVRVVASGVNELQGEGTTQDGYRVSTVSAVGALGSMSIKDAPYAINVISQDLITNIQAQSPDDIYRVNPTTVSQTPQATGWAPMVKIRGFNSYDRAEDGMRRMFGFATSLEDKERVEVLSGLSGFLYGAASPGGMVNYVNKRPTQERLNSVTVGNYGGSQYYTHGDFGGPVDEDGKLGYRLNVVRQKGETAVDDQKIDRTLATLAADWHITNRFKVELNASYSDYKTDAPTAYWFFREGVPRSKAPDSSKNWGQPWVQDEIKSRKWSGKMIYEVNDNLTLRAAHLRDYQDRPKQDHTMNAVRAPGQYHQIAIHSGDTRTQSEAWQALADLSFTTGVIDHKVTMGYYGFTDRQWTTTYSPNTGYLGPYGLDSPVHAPEPTWPENTANQYYAGSTKNDNFMIGDMLRFTDQWSALVGINHSIIKTVEFSETGSYSSPKYERSRNSPNASLIYQPTDWLTTYATYIEGLEQGGLAPETASNRLAIMPPMVSKQKELGVKAQLGGVLLGAAVFDIDKAYEYTNNSNVYTQDGRQRHRGGELTAFGKVTDEWTVVGGLTALSAKVQGGASSGNAPMNVPKVVAKLYSEYALSFVPGLSATGGIYHVGKQWASEKNSSRLPSYTTADLGLRYSTKVDGRPVSLRLNVNNVTNRNYWLNSYYLGSPRSIAFSAQVTF